MGSHGPGGWEVGPSAEAEVGSRQNLWLQVVPPDSDGGRAGKPEGYRILQCLDDSLGHRHVEPDLVGDPADGVTRRLPTASARRVEDLDADLLSGHARTVPRR